MLDLGFDSRARGVDDWEAIRWAAFDGHADMLRPLLSHRPPIGVRDPTYGGTLLGHCVYGSLHGWHANTVNYAESVGLLLEAGEHTDPSDLPTGRDDVDAVLRSYLRRRGDATSP